MKLGMSSQDFQDFIQTILDSPKTMISTEGEGNANSKPGTEEGVGRKLL
jgi:hypothetical protein